MINMQLKKNFIYLIIFLSIFFLLGCIEEEQVIDETISEVDTKFEWIAQGDLNDSHIQIDHPSDWIIETHIFGQYSDFIRPTRENYIFPEMINVNKLDLFDFEIMNDRPMTLSEYTSDTLMAFSEYLINFNLIESKPTTLMGEPAHEVLFTSYREDLGVEIMTKSIWTIKDNKAYSVSYNAKRDTFYTYLPVANEMIESFEIN